MPLICVDQSSVLWAERLAGVYYSSIIVQENHDRSGGLRLIMLIIY